jgi:hypothetical protein
MQFKKLWGGEMDGDQYKHNNQPPPGRPPLDPTTPPCLLTSCKQACDYCGMGIWKTTVKNIQQYAV